MKKTLYLLSLIVLIAAFVTPACSSHNHKSTSAYDSHIGDVDLNDDEKISFEEFKKSFPNGEKEVFEKADGDKDGLIDHDEWHEFKEAKGYEHKE